MMRVLGEFEHKDIVYILEENLNKKKRNTFMGFINNGKYENENALLKRFSEKWLLCDALSFSLSLKEAVEMYYNTITDLPMNKYRIIKAQCVYHEQYGIAISDFDYKRVKLLKKSKKEMIRETFIRIKSIFKMIKFEI